MKRSESAFELQSELKSALGKSFKLFDFKCPTKWRVWKEKKDEKKLKDTSWEKIVDEGPLRIQ